MTWENARMADFALEPMRTGVMQPSRCRGKFEHGWQSKAGYLLEALGVSPGQGLAPGLQGSRAPSRAPSQHVSQPALALAPAPFDLPRGYCQSWPCSSHTECSIFHVGLLLPHIDHGGDWCLGLRRRQKLQFQPHPSLEHPSTAGFAQGG